MPSFFAKRVIFRNGERHSVLQMVNGLPVHEVTVYLAKYRTKGRAANTIHFVCRSIALLYRHLDGAKINLFARLAEGSFLTSPELERLAAYVQYRLNDLDEESEGQSNSKVINIAKIAFRKKNADDAVAAVHVSTQASRLRYIADFLQFSSRYIGATLDASKRQQLDTESICGLRAFREHIPAVPNRAKLNARVGLSLDEQNRLLDVIHPESPDNPWVRRYTRLRNWLFVVVLLASGMRRGELLGLQISDLSTTEPKLRIIRRADEGNDPRLVQPVTKTSDREIELAPPIMKALWNYINNERRGIKAARKVPQVFVSDDGAPLSHASIDKLFLQIREACPDLPVELSSHVMRHTWNERFSEKAEALGLSESVEEKARNTQQGWSDNSKMSATYTRRHTARKGREVSLKLQEQLDAKISSK